MKTRVNLLGFILAHSILQPTLIKKSCSWPLKNSMLINRHKGSFFIIGSLLLNQEIKTTYQASIEVDHCGQCTRCIDACPTEAIDIHTRTIKAIDCMREGTWSEIPKE